MFLSDAKEQDCQLSDSVLRFYTQWPTTRNIESLPEDQCVRYRSFLRSSLNGKADSCILMPAEVCFSQKARCSLEIAKNTKLTRDYKHYMSNEQAWRYSVPNKNILQGASRIPNCRTVAFSKFFLRSCQNGISKAAS